MILNKKATSIAEAIIVMLVVVSGVTGMYNIYTKSLQLAKGTENKIEAIQIARQGIEAFTNIRDTNWLIYSSDYKNCWDSLNYNVGCINSTTNTIENNGKYIIYKNSDNRWALNDYNLSSNNFSDSDYKDKYKIYLDNNGIYTQSGGINTSPLYTREINIVNNGDDKMIVKSLVQWVDYTSSGARRVELEQTLTNWKK